MDRLAFLTAAYAAVWLISFGYIFILVRRNRRLQDRLDKMEASVAKLQSEHNAGRSDG
jgi:CcmD family protein